VWTAPGETGYLIFVGLNIEITLMFAVSGVIFVKMLPKDRSVRILGGPNRWLFAVVNAIFCVFVECLLNMGGHLVWEYPCWYLSLKGIPLIFLIGYFHFFCAAIWVITRKTITAKISILVFIYTVPIVMNVIAFASGWRY
jgi:hypothetical protein